MNTILILDETQEERQSLHEGIRQAGHQVHICQGGAAALDAVTQTQPDLIVLDRHLSEDHGVEICACVPQDPGNRDIPVIVLSSPDRPEQERQVLKSGAVDYLTKPIRFEQLLRRIQMHLTLRNLHASLERKEAQLQEARVHLRTLSGFLTVCARCKSIHAGHGTWKPIELYLEASLGICFTHGICPDCLDVLHGNDPWNPHVKAEWDGHAEGGRL